MKITSFDVRAMSDRLLGEESSITIETTQGRFSIKEQPDGSLSIHESSHNHLAVLPRTGNSIDIHAIPSPNFRKDDE